MGRAVVKHFFLQLAGRARPFIGDRPRFRSSVAINARPSRARPVSRFHLLQVSDRDDGIDIPVGYESDRRGTAQSRRLRNCSPIALLENRRSEASPMFSAGLRRGTASSIVDKRLAGQKKFARSLVEF
jgi:hypothetical protein